MFERLVHAPLFPTHLWVHQLAEKDYQPINRRLLEFLDERLAACEPSGMLTHQTEHDLHKTPPLEPLLPFFNAAVEGAFEFLKLKERGFVITGCWANVAEPGGTHKAHCHPNNFLAGVYYASVPTGADEIQFEDPRSCWRHVAPDVTEQTPENSNTITYTVKTGSLILFPAWLTHNVPPNRSHERRVSVSFNVMFSRFEETISQPQWTGKLKLPSTPA